MTAPSAPDTAVPDEETMAFELLALVRVTSVLGSQIARLISLLLVSYDGATLPGGGLADTAAKELRAKAIQALRSLVIPRMGEELAQVAREARDLGVERALAGLSPSARSTASQALQSRGAAPEVPDVDKAVQERLGEAAAVAAALPMKTKADLGAVIGRTNSAQSLAESTVRTVAHQQLNAGVSEVAEALGRRLLWVAERNGCLHCLAYAGWAVEPGGLFPVALTYADTPLGLDAVPYPPRHPNCRCQVRVYTGPAGAPDPDKSANNAASALAREARRSVVTGKTDYASDGAALRAADRLLRAGANLPTSVEARARRRVDRQTSR